MFFKKKKAKEEQEADYAVFALLAMGWYNAGLETGLRKAVIPNFGFAAHPKFYPFWKIGWDEGNRVFEKGAE